MIAIQPVVGSRVARAEAASGNSTLSGASCSTSYSDVCFHVLGVDILLDANLKPWLLEVNTSPDTSPSSPMDKRIKSSIA